jgi:hypothetical protein
MKPLMKNDEKSAGISALPFLFRFATPLPEILCPLLRYDSIRQLSQAFINGEWIDAVDADIEVMRESRHTRVRPETQDE